VVLSSTELVSYEWSYTSSPTTSLGLYRLIKRRDNFPFFTVASPWLGWTSDFCVGQCKHRITFERVTRAASADPRARKQEKRVLNTINLISPVHGAIWALKHSTNLTHNHVIYVAPWLPETKGNDFPVIFLINNFRFYGGDSSCVLTVKYFLL
jgi:hypothetical protein